MVAGNVMAGSKGSGPTESLLLSSLSGLSILPDAFLVILPDIKNFNIISFLAAWLPSGELIAICALLLIGGTALFIFSRNKKLEHKELIETEKAINSLATSLHEQTNVEDILWDVSRNCISKLGFEDCVIYLLDKERKMLVQKAAWGPKTNMEQMIGREVNSETITPFILNPIEIPVGNGIVGTVAITGHAEIVNDVTKDERYIVDDKKRCSEISVPICYNEEVIGIIDSEHSRKNFFKRRHLSILSTIASICAQKIVRVKAEVDKHNAQMELLDYKRKTAEAQLKSLRLQMNPHFLFNSLNSIQQIILSGDEKSATLYLSKFSRLLRHVLIYSDKEKITLKEELEMLRLYVELESLRFKESFHYEITCDENVDTDEIEIPTLLIQPFVENAIWHGIIAKEGERSLRIRLMEDNAQNVVCEVEDNGIGREASRKIHNQNNHSGKGINVAGERLQAYNFHHRQKSNVMIVDLLDEYGKAAGTRVVMTLPLLN
ncbi:hypothetical protein BH20BAC1_BH20BAC1_10970 [soil metagenome]